MDQVSRNSITRLLSAAMCGDGVSWPEHAGRPGSQQVIDAIRGHGIAALLHARASRLANWPDQVLAYLRDAAAASAVWELRHCQNLKEILAALDREGVRPLLFKGTALAYGLYEHAPLRIRGDSDLLVAPGDRAKAVAVFLDHDHAALTPIDRVTVTTQATFERRAGDGTSHHFDLH